MTPMTVHGSTRGHTLRDDSRPQPSNARDDIDRVLGEASEYVYNGSTLIADTPTLVGVLATALLDIADAVRENTAAIRDATEKGV